MNMTNENKSLNQENHNADEKIDEYLKKLQDKYGYNNELILTLKKIIPAFVEHYGKEHEQLILDAISSCEIHMQQENETPQEYLLDFFQTKLWEEYQQ